jgi:hypothetical protein
MKRVIALIVAVVALAGCTKQPEAMSPGTFLRLIEECRVLGGSARPDYDKEDPTKIYGVRCVIDKTSRHG